MLILVIRPNLTIINIQRLTPNIVATVVKDATAPTRGKLTDSQQHVDSIDSQPV